MTDNILSLAEHTGNSNLSRPRRKPYTARGISRVPCFRCKAPSFHQWQICADRNRWRGVCLPCDIALNDVVLRFFRDPQRKRKIEAYRQMARGQG